MSKTLLIASLAAICRLAAAAPQTYDAAGVTVTLNGASVLHRTAVGYPPDALRNGVQGLVSLEVKLDSTGAVSDAQVLSGPEELRKAALSSILQWHFSQDLAGTTRMIQIGFELPKSPAGTARGPSAPTRIQTGTVRSIRVVGLSEQASADLLSRLPIHEDEEWNPDSAQKSNQAVRAFDDHFTIFPSTAIQTSGTVPQLDLVIASTPGRIKVGGNVQGAMAIRKVPPEYPPAAKAAGIQGVVRLAAVIGADGAVQQVTVLDGPPELTQSAMDAVKQWVYKPTLLNGNPVQVETTIDINFTLNR